MDIDDRLERIEGICMGDQFMNVTIRMDAIELAKEVRRLREVITIQHADTTDSKVVTADEPVCCGECQRNLDSALEEVKRLRSTITKLQARIDEDHKYDFDGA